MHVRVNAAVSADGKLSTRRREQVAISGPEDFDRVERLRAAADAIAVGVGTVLADDPRLTVDEPALRAEREARGEEPQPVRVVVDSRARTPTDAGVVDDAARTVVLACGSAAPAERRETLADAGAEVVAVAGDVPSEPAVRGADGNESAAGGPDGSGSGAGVADASEPAAGDADASGHDHVRVDLAAGLDALEARGIDDLLVEGGGELLFSLFEAGLVDELRTFVGPTVIGGRDAPTLADGPGFAAIDEFVDLELESVEHLDGGVALEWSVA